MGSRPMRPATSVVIPFNTENRPLSSHVYCGSLGRPAIAAYPLCVGSMSQTHTGELVHHRFGRHAASTCNSYPAESNPVAVATRRTGSAGGGARSSLN